MLDGALHAISFYEDAARRQLSTKFRGRMIGGSMDYAIDAAPGSVRRLTTSASVSNSGACWRVGGWKRTDHAHVLEVNVVGASQHSMGILGRSLASLLYDIQSL
jgi:hypothetical protein